MTVTETSSNLDDLAAEAVRLGRDVAHKARALQFGGSAGEVAFVARCLARLGDRQPFVEADDGSLSAIGEMLDKDIAQEIIGTDQRFIETHFDELGQQGEIREVPIYSVRGMALLDFRTLFHRFLAARRAVLDHMAVHRALVTMMSD